MSWDALIRGESRRLELVGEYYYRDAYERHFPCPPDGEPHVSRVQLELHPEPHNVHDRNAVAVRYMGDVIAYVARTNAARLQAEVLRANRAGATIFVEAAVGVQRGRDGGIEEAEAMITLPVLRDIYPQAMAQKGRAARSGAPTRRRQPPRPTGPMTSVGVVRDLVTFIAAVLVGYLGIDRFINGNIGLGLLKLITLGGFGVWWIADILIFGARWLMPTIQHHRAKEREARQQQDREAEIGGA
ncbi:NINE protein [Brachybacterium sp. EE-P12]|uniref:NINE protein n=1 Tax=Brachybacterium sp. EE-P12 TaxID=2306299 RepID=UPI001F153AA9|nr:NINE protein [Brachybacterium sp. EE-P12]